MTDTNILNNWRVNVKLKTDDWLKRRRKHLLPSRKRPANNLRQKNTLYAPKKIGCCHLLTQAIKLPTSTWSRRRWSSLLTRALRESTTGSSTSSSQINTGDYALFSFRVDLSVSHSTLKRLIGEAVVVLQTSAIETKARPRLWSRDVEIEIGWATEVDIASP